MRRAIINADDFGLCRGVNEGIIKAHREGILTSATLMANMPGFEEAVALSRENPRLGVGVHLNVLRGKPVLPPDKVPTLVAPSGLMWGSVYVFLRRFWAGRILLADVEAELRAQVEKVLAAGVPATHVDSEKHIHTIPAVFRIVARIIPDYGLRRVRFISEFCLSARPAQTVKSWAISLACRRMRRVLREHAIMTADRFYGLCGSGRMTVRRLARILEGLGEGTAEIMLHPGYMTEELVALERLTGSYYINNRRELELRSLLDPAAREVVTRRSIELITYREI